MRLVPALLALLLLAPGSAGASVLHASPAGAGPPPCLPAAPCDLEDAVAQAGAGDEIRLAAGAYAPSSTLPTAAPGLLLTGPADGDLPTVALPPGGRLSLFGAGSRLAHVRVTGEPGLGLPLVQAPVIDHVIALAGGVGDGCAAATAVLDSVCSSRLGAGFALRAVNGGPTVLTLRNATLAGGTHGIQIATAATVSTIVEVLLRNSIARGGAGDVRLDPFRSAFGAEASISMTADHSRYGLATTWPSAGSADGPGGAEIVDAGGVLDGDPGFRDAAALDFRLAPGSAAIDAGSAAAPLSETDVLGRPRVQHGAPDLGAHESVPPPPAALIESPAAGASVSGALTVRWVLPADAQPGSVSVRLVPRAGGEPLSFPAAGAGAGAHELVVPRTGLPDGLYDVVVTYREPLEGVISDPATAAGVVLATPAPAPAPGATEAPGEPGASPRGGAGRAAAPVAGPRCRGLRARAAGRVVTVSCRASVRGRVRVVLERAAGRGWKRVAGATRRAARPGLVTVRLRARLPRGRLRVRVVADDGAGRAGPAARIALVRRR